MEFTVSTSTSPSPRWKLRDRSVSADEVGIFNSFGPSLVDPNLFLPPLSPASSKNYANFVLISKAAQNRKEQYDAINMKRVESYQMDNFVKDDIDPVQSLRITSAQPPELKKYLTQRLMESQLQLEEETNPVLKDIELKIKDDKRFSKEDNDAIRHEVYKRIHDLKFQIFKKMEKMERNLNKKGVLDEETNHIRVRSLFKVELQKLLTAMYAIHKEVLHEMELRNGLEPDWMVDRKFQRSKVLLEEIRPSTSNQTKNKLQQQQQQQQSHSFAKPRSAQINSFVNPMILRAASLSRSRSASNIPAVDNNSTKRVKRNSLRIEGCEVHLEDANNKHDLRKKVSV